MAPSSVIVTSRFHESITRHALRSYLSEFISTFFYVFLVVGSGMSSRQYPPPLPFLPMHKNPFISIRVSFCSLLFFPHKSVHDHSSQPLKDFQKKKIKRELDQFLKPLWWFYFWYMLRMKRIQVATFIC